MKVLETVLSREFGSLALVAHGPQQWPPTPAHLHHGLASPIHVHEGWAQRIKELCFQNGGVCDGGRRRGSKATFRDMTTCIRGIEKLGVET